MNLWWHQLKFLIAYLVPASALLAVTIAGPWSWSTVLLAFVLIPGIEAGLGGHGGNFAPGENERLRVQRWFDLLLYLNLPLLWLIILGYAQNSLDPTLSFSEWMGMSLSAGIAAGATGINVAHELGHREDAFHQWIARLLLLPELYLHFTIEHNYGHHRHIATPRDPATARRGEPVYLFWLRSIAGSYAGAWRIEGQRLSQEGLSRWNWRNRMWLFLGLQVLYLGAMAMVFGPAILPGLLLLALVGILLLETINYIEHYGLLRAQLPGGRYEPVNITHSWNSNHDLGRIFLYELTRHADHHDKANRKYQELRHFEASPQLPLGYPASILMALVPPLWFRVMDPRLPAIAGVARN